MENKANKATPQRPEGDRIINADLLELDLNKLIAQIKNEPTWQTSERNTMTIFKSDSMRILLIGLHKNGELKTHTANGIISVQVLQGNIQFTAEQTRATLDKGQMLTLQANIPHSVLGLEESFFIVTLAINKK